MTLNTEVVVCVDGTGRVDDPDFTDVGDLTSLSVGAGSLGPRPREGW